jgi:SSS family solute:Na+ symporter
VSPGILAVFMLGLFYKKTTNKAAIIGILISIPVAFALKTAVLGMPFMDQMLYTMLITMAVIVFVSLATNPQSDDPKGIALTSDFFKTDKTFTISSYAIILVLVVLYAIFW